MLCSEEAGQLRGRDAAHVDPGAGILGGKGMGKALHRAAQDAVCGVPAAGLPGGEIDPPPATGRHAGQDGLAKHQGAVQRDGPLLDEALFVKGGEGGLDGGQGGQVDKAGGGGVAVGQVAEEGPHRQRLGEVGVVGADEARAGLAEPGQPAKVAAALGQDALARLQGGQQPLEQGKAGLRGRAGDEVGVGRKNPSCLVLYLQVSIT